MDYFTVLPNEILHNILKDLSPLDLATLSACCGVLHRFICDNRLLFRELYIARLDEPPDRPNGVDYDWIEEIHHFVKMHKILGPKMSAEEKTQYLGFMTETVTRWMQTAAPSHEGKSLNVKLLTDLFEDRKNQEVFFCNSSIYARARRDRHQNGASEIPRSYEERQMSAKLHTLYGVPVDLLPHSRFNAAYPYACSVLYDLRNYTEGNMWGPYKDDGIASADWEKLEAVMVVLGHNLRMFTQNTRGIFKPLWDVPWFGASPNSYSPIMLGKLKSQPSPPKNALDPYNISGTWMRVVCFLDFSEFFAYNFNAPIPADGGPREPIDTSEAIRLIIMELEVAQITEPGEDDGQGLPVVHFLGKSRSMHSQWDPNATSNIMGTVRLTKEGEVRWTSISVYQGQERWKSEGIQIGGVKSSRGVLGHWFDKDHDHHGPAGPTAFWKVSNEIDDTQSVHPDETADEEDEEEDEEDEDYEPDGEGDGEEIDGNEMDFSTLTTMQHVFAVFTALQNISQD